MPFVYLSFLTRLQSLFKGIMDKLFVPVLSAVLQDIFKILLSLLQQFLNKFLFQGFCYLLKLIDYICQMFDVLCGLTPVSYGSEKNLTILEALFKIEGISRSFARLTLAAIILTFLFSMFSVIRAMGDTAMENRHPISEAVRWAAKSALTFALIPLLCIGLLQTSRAVFLSMSQIDYTDNWSGNQKVVIQGSTAGDVLFVSMIQEALNYPNTSDYQIQEDDSDAVKAQKEERRREYKSERLACYLTRLGEMPRTVYTYTNTEQVETDVDTSKINMAIPLASAGCLLILMLGACLTLVRRTFELLVLYLVSPFFASTIALDGGETFKKWREAFVGKFFAGLGTLVSMKLFLAVLPIIASNRITYSRDSTINTVLVTLFVLGSAWAIFHGNTMIQQILDPSGAAAEQGERDRILGYALGSAGMLGRGAGQLMARGKGEKKG